MKHKLVSAALAATAMFSFGSAQAAISFDLTSASLVCPAGFGNTCSGLTSSGVSLSAAAYSNTGGAGTGAGGLSTSAIETAHIEKYPGLGINNQDGVASGSGDVGDLVSTAPEHAIDNDQRQEMALFSFSRAVALTQVAISYPGAGSTLDSDLTVMAYTGFGTPGSIVGLTFGQLLTNGWALVSGNIQDVANQPGSTGTIQGVSATSTYSSYWLIGTYNSLVATGGDTAIDYAKLSTLAGEICGTATQPGAISNGRCGGTGGGGGTIPEPGVLALMAGGLLLMRRRFARQA